MKASISLLAAVLLAVGLSFTFSSSHADEDNQTVSADENIGQESTIAQLMERIDSLENRLASLEGSGTLIRQADSRGTPEMFRPAIHARRAKQSEDDAPTEYEDDSAQKTNGQKWTFQLLGHLKPTDSAVR